MPEEHPNAAAARRLFDAFAARDIGTAMLLMPEDVVWRFPGVRGRLAGEHRGREGIMRFLTQVMVLTGGTFHMEIEDFAASDDGAVVTFTGHAERAGKTLRNPTALRIQIRNGLLAEFDEFVWDLAHVEEFWS